MLVFILWCFYTLAEQTLESAHQGRFWRANAGARASLDAGREEAMSAVWQLRRRMRLPESSFLWDTSGMRAT